MTFNGLKQCDNIFFLKLDRGQLGTSIVCGAIKFASLNVAH